LKIDDPEFSKDARPLALGPLPRPRDKVAAYGFLRIALPLFPHGSVHYQELMLLIALASILYGSAMAFTQTNLRLILGYSSLAQLAFITLGIFSLRPEGVQGAVLQSINHGLVVAPLFFIVLALTAWPMAALQGVLTRRFGVGTAFRMILIANAVAAVAVFTAYTIREDATVAFAAYVLYSVAFELVRLWPRLRIVLMTGMELTPDEAAICQRQDIPILRKPFLAEDLVRFIQPALLNWPRRGARVAAS